MAWERTLPAALMRYLDGGSRCKVDSGESLTTHEDSKIQKGLDYAPGFLMDLPAQVWGGWRNSHDFQTIKPHGKINRRLPQFMNDEILFYRPTVQERIEIYILK